MVFSANDQSTAAPLVARRDDLNDTDDAAERVADGDAVASVRRHLLSSPDDVPGLRRSGDDDGSSRRLDGSVARRATLKRDHVRHDASGVLLDQGGEALREKATVQGIANADAPRLVKVMKQVRIDDSPIVDRHDLPPGGENPIGMVLRGDRSR